MSSAPHADPPDDGALPQPTGTGALVLGAAAVAAIACPLLPESVPPVVRHLPLLFVLPLGIWAVGSGGIALRRLRGEEGARRVRARAGVALGAVAVLTSVAVLSWAWWALSHI